MAKKFLIAVAGIVAVMAALVILPGVSRQSGTVSIEYRRDAVSMTDTGLYEIQSRETLRIGNDGSAKYYRPNGQVLEFTVASEELKVLRELFLSTGFMQIPSRDYAEKTGVANFTRYDLSIKSEDGDQSIRWVNPEASGESIPSVIINAGSRLDAIIERKSR